MSLVKGRSLTGIAGLRAASAFKAPALPQCAGVVARNPGTTSPCPPHVLLQQRIRGRLLQLCQDLRDDCRLLDAGNHLALPAAARAGVDLNTKDALGANTP